MLSKEIFRVAREIVAAKWSNVLKAFYEDQIIKNEFNKNVYEDLNESEVVELQQKLQPFMDEVDKRIQDLAKNFTDKKDDVPVYKWIVSVINTNKIDILNDESYFEIQSSCKNFKEFRKFLDNDKQQFNKYKTFSALNDVVYPYIREKKQNEKAIEGFEKVGQSGEYVILKLTDYEKSVKLYNKQGITWCVKSKSFWDTYGAPYYLVMVKYQPYYLINFNSSQFSDPSQGKKAPIDEKLGKLIYDLIKKENGGKCVFTTAGGQSKNWDIMYPYYPISEIFKTNDVNIIKDCVKQSFVSNDNKRYEELVKELKARNMKFDGDDLIDVITDEKQFVKATDSEISNGITLNKKNVIKLLFNSFKRGNSGKTLFKKMLSYVPSENNPDIYIESKDNPTANIDAKDASGKNLLYYCATKSQIMLLLSYGINITEEDYDRIFKNAINESNIDTIKFLTSQEKVKISESTIIAAMQSRHRAIIKMFLDSGLDFNTVMYENVTPLIYTIYNRMNSVLEDFIASGKINLEQEINGYNALEACLDQHNDEALDMLINAGAFLNKVFESGDLHGKTLVKICVEQNNIKLLESCVKKGADVNTSYPLHYCIENHKYDFAKLLINDKDTNFILQDENGNTALMLAIIKKNRDLVLLILSKTQKGLGLSNRDGFTPLMLMIEYDFSADDIIKIFKNPTKNIDGKKIDFKSALDIAYDKVQTPNIKKIIDFLNIANNSRPKNKQFDATNQMYNFVISGNLTGLKGLLEGDQKHTIDFLVNKNGANVLHVAVQAKYVEILDYLVSYIERLDRNILKKLKEQKFRGMTPEEMINKALKRLRPSDSYRIKDYQKMSEILGNRTIISKIMGVLNKYIR